MSKVIIQYPLQFTQGDQEVLASPNAEFLTVQTQEGQPFLWALVDKRCKQERTHILNFYFSYSPIPTNPGKYLATLQAYGQVWHAFIEEI